MGPVASACKHKDCCGLAHDLCWHTLGRLCALRFGNGVLTVHPNGHPAVALLLAVTISSARNGRACRTGYAPPTPLGFMRRSGFTPLLEVHLGLVQAAILVGVLAPGRSYSSLRGLASTSRLTEARALWHVRFHRAGDNRTVLRGSACGPPCWPNTGVVSERAHGGRSTCFPFKTLARHRLGADLRSQPGQIPCCLPETALPFPSCQHHM